MTLLLVLNLNLQMLNLMNCVDNVHGVLPVSFKEKVRLCRKILTPIPRYFSNDYL
jgi:hypothetical protein